MKRVVRGLRGMRHSGRAVRVAILLLVAGAIAVAVPLFRVSHAAAWWIPPGGGQWNYRRKITLDTTAWTSNLTNFPLLITLDSSTIGYAKLQSQGQDIRFIDEDGVTQLSYEIEQWNTSGTSYVWVGKPLLYGNSSTHYIWMYYGNASAADGQNASGAWDNNYFIVQHANGASGVIGDSTSNGYSGTPSASGHPVSTASGKIGSAFTYSVSNANDWYTMQQRTTLLNDFTDGNWSISAWVKASSSPSSTHEFAIAGKRGQYGGLQVSVGPKLLSTVRDSSGGVHNAQTPSNISLNTWYFVEQVIDNSTMTNYLYVNGALSATASYTSLYNYYPGSADSSQVPVVGKGDPNTACSQSYGFCMDGVIDEVRYSSTPRSADWVEAEYNTDTNAINSFGAEEIYPPDAPVLVSPSSGATVSSLQPQLQLRSSDQHSPNYLRYKIQVCSNSDCSSVLRTIDQTSSQTGWSGQDAQSGTAYVASSTLASSTLAAHTYQAPGLSLGTQYWWRAAAIDPADSNSWSDWSAIQPFMTQAPPAAPTLYAPLSSALVSPMTLRFQLATTDVNGDNVKYKIQVCSNSDCSSVLRTIDQTSSQTGWLSQNTDSATTYSASPSAATASQQALHMYQPPLLAANTQYWWRAYAIDPSGTNTWSTASSISTFTTPAANAAGSDKTRILGGTRITGGSKF